MASGFSGTRLLSVAQLGRLREHKYSAQGTSLVEPVMQIYWRWLVEQIPKTWAPNTLTIVGLILNVVTTLILVYYSPDAKQEAPRWTYLFCGVGLFIYQSLDAIDGKQARRTGSATPLGELFDHGCDSVSTAFVMLGCCVSLKLGNHVCWLFYESMIASFLFYCAHWQTYVTGTLKFGKLDVTEGQFTVMAIYLLTGLFGTSIWDIKVPVFGFPMCLIPVYASLLPGLYQLKTNFSVIFMQGGIGKNGSTVAGTSTVFPLIPITIVVVLAVMIGYKSPTHIAEEHPCLYVLTFGIIASKVTNRMVVAHMTKSEMDMVDSSLFGPTLLFLNQYCNCFINEYIVLWIAFIFCSLDIARYSYQVCREICDFLNIFCFNITMKRTRSSSRENGRHTTK